MLRSLSRRFFGCQVVNSAAEAVADIPNGAFLGIGGFGLCGLPENLIDALREQGTSGLTVASNNCGTDTFGTGLLLHTRQIKRMISSYVGENKEFERQYLSGELEVELTPQGTLAARLQAAGNGVPAFYTKTGAGTPIEDGSFPIKFERDGNNDVVMPKPREKRVFDGMDYILEEALKPQYGLVKAWKGDKMGNLIFKRSANNFNSLVAMASEITIAEVEELVEPGELDPDMIHTPGIFINRILQGPGYKKPIEKVTVDKGQGFVIPGKGDAVIKRERIIRRAAKELKDGMYVNLGIGMPTLAGNFLDPGVHIVLQSENGLLGMGPYPMEGDEHPDLINAGKETVTLIPGSSTFNSADSFGMIRAGKVDLTILGGLQVSRAGDLANWIIPGKMVKGMGGAMDLVASPSRCIVTMEHTAKGTHKILDQCELPLTGKGVVDLLITDMAVFDFEREGGMTLTEIAKDTSVDEIKANTGCDFILASDLKEMIG